MKIMFNVMNSTHPSASESVIKYQRAFQKFYWLTSVIIEPAKLKLEHSLFSKLYPITPPHTNQPQAILNKFCQYFRLPAAKFLTSPI